MIAGLPRRISFRPFARHNRSAGRHASPLRTLFARMRDRIHPTNRPVAPQNIAAPRILEADSLCPSSPAPGGTSESGTLPLPVKRNVEIVSPKKNPLPGLFATSNNKHAHPIAETLDPVTKLYDRFAFEARLSDSLRRLHSTIVEGEVTLAVLCLDINGFDTIVKVIGCDAADSLLSHLAQLMRDVFPEQALLGRIRGEEFVVCLVFPEENPSTNRETYIIDKVAALQQRLATPVSLCAQDIYLSLNAGVAMHPQGEVEASELIQGASVALYQTKRSHQGGHMLYEPEMSKTLCRRLRLASDLKRAVERNELRLDFQPILSAGTRLGEEKRCIIGVEALLRWYHPEEGLLAPSNFISIAEESGIIGELGKWVLTNACQQVARWRNAGFDIQVAVNLSAQQFFHTDIAEEVREALRTSGINASALHLEITESTLMDGGDASLDVLHRLHQQGVELVLDDFGTGYSSLAYLHLFPVHMIKVDRAFVERLPEPRTSAIVQALVGMAHTLDMRVIAEGVETDNQAVLLGEMGCDAFQGFHFGVPMTADAISNLLHTNPSP
jgi:diguanylate cyclase (GGDEF)-like protein